MKEIETQSVFTNTPTIGNEKSALKVSAMIGKLLLILSFPFFTSNAQGFDLSTSVSDIDSILDERVDISSETDDLFDFITKFKYCDYDDVNEFEKARKLQENNEVIEKLKSNWKLRYSLKITRGVIATDKNEVADFRLSKYNFANKTFSIVFGTSSHWWSLRPDRDKLREITINKTSRNATYIGTKLIFELDKSQSHAFSFNISPDKAETLKEMFSNYEVTLNAAIKIISVGNQTFQIERNDEITGVKLGCYCAVRITYKFQCFIIKDPQNNKILVWREP